jgi:hypothetical protein
MKKFLARKELVFCYFFLMSLFLFSCEPKRVDGLTLMENAFRGKHELHRMAEMTSVSSSLSGGFFLFFGGISEQTKTETLVKFSWKMNDGTYAFSSMRLENIRVKFDEKAVTPTIEFYLKRQIHFGEQSQNFIDYNVEYALVTIRESDWPSKPLELFSK